MRNPGRHGPEPVWRPRRRLSSTELPPGYRPWLLDRASLTRRLRCMCPETFRVQLLSQERVRPLLNEARRLGMRPGLHGVVRQVYLLCHGVPWVYARTVFPPQTLRGRGRRLNYLHAQPLGSLLFADPDLRRDEMEIACLRPGDEFYRLATRALDPAPEVIWGRRSVFWLHERPILVSELFLPALGEFRP